MQNYYMGEYMRTLLLASASVIAIASAAPASAADLPAKAPAMVAPMAIPFSWTGLYVGAHVGWGNSHLNVQGFLPSGTPTSFNTGSANVSGSIFGGQLGYNWQFAPQWVIGIEGMFAGSGMNGFSYPAACCFMWSKVDALASVTGRLGWTPYDPRQMVYIKGGYAWVKNEYLFSYGINTTETQGGWTIGGGFEWAPTWAPNWSFFVEYDYYKFGDHTTNVYGSETNPSHAAINQAINTVKVGANYRFNLGGR
jgi:outer membrane immunogenic protein